VQPTRVQQWFARSTPLFVYHEFWRPDIDHPEADRIRAQGHGELWVTFLLTESLLYNVMDAAGAIEYTVGKLEDALDADQAWIDQREAERDPAERPAGAMVGPNRNAISWEVANLLWWLKTLRERMKAHVSGREIGLLPALAPDEPWTKRIRDLYSALHARALDDVKLANVATHGTAAPSAFGFTKLEAGRAVHPVPDTPKRGDHVLLGSDLTYDVSRDARSFARSTLAAVEAFMDGLLSAFEEGAEEIARRREAAGAPPLNEF
jgi:hypothetical protein